MTAVGFESGDATRVELTLSPAVLHRDTGITVSYAKGTNPLKDGDDNEVASFTRRPVTNDTPDTTPTVSGASVNGATLTITFSEALDTTAAPTASVFSVGGTDASTSVTAVGFKNGDATRVELMLSPAVSHGDTGIAVSYSKGSNPLKDGDDNEVASFTRLPVTNDTPDTTAPTVSGASVNRATLTITFSETLDTTAAPPASVFSVGGTDVSTSVTAVGFKSGDATRVELTLSPAVAHGDRGITVSYAKGANPLKDGDDNEVASFTGQPVANDTEDSAEVDSVTISSQAGSDAVYAIGDRIEATVTFDTAVTVTGTPRLALSIGGETRQAAYAAGRSGGGDGAEVVFGYTVAEGDSDSDGVAIAADALSAGAGAIRSGTADAALGHAAVAADSGHRVDGVRPSIAGAPSVTSTPSEGDGYYRSLERITLALPFSEAVTVDTTSGTPRLGVSVGASERPAGYDAGSGTATLAFSWPVKPADLDADGVSVAANRLTLRGGTITDLAGNAPANLNHAALETQSGHGVAGNRSPPQFADESVSFTIAEDHEDGASLGTVTAGDADGDVLTYALSGDDADLFDLAHSGPSANLSVAAGATLSYESATSYALTVTATDRSGLSAAVAVTVDVTDVLEPPVWGTEAPTLTNKFSTSVTVGWTSPDVTGRPPVHQFQITALELDSEGNARTPLVIERKFIDDGSATSGTITGLKPSTGYEVSVAAENAEGSSRSASVVFTTQSPNDPPKGYDPATCAADASDLALSAPALTQVELGPLHGGSSEAGACFGSSTGQASYFWDPDGDSLSMSVAVESPPAAVWRGTIGGEQSPVIDAGGTRLQFLGLAARAATELVAVVTANDGRGGTGSRRVVITVEGFSGSAVPSFGTQVADRTYQLGAAMPPLVLPAASGGDLGHGTSGDVFDYVYGLSGTPSGLSFDAQTRTLSGTPDEWGKFELTYTAQDADLDQGTADTASQTFTVTVPPRLTEARYSSDPGDDGTYAIGDQIVMSLHLGTGGGGVSVVGSPLPQLAVQVGDQERLTSYAGATGVGRYVYQLYFTYTVQEGDADADGVSIEANALRLNGATVVTSDGAALSTEHDALPFLWLRVDEVHGVDGVRPAVSSATVDGDSLTITFDEALDGGSAPAGSAFTVKGIGVDQSPTGVSISGAAVRLTLGAGAVHGHRVTVDYETPSSNPLRDAAGNAAASFTGQVMNDTADQPEPEVTGASVNGSTLTLTFDEALDTTAPPAASTFGVGGTAASTSVTAVGFERGDATKLELTVSPAVAHGDTGITVSYAKGANPLQDGEGNEVASFTRQPVTNDTPPAFSSAAVSKSTLTITFDGTLRPSSRPAPAAFTVKGAGADQTPAAVAVSGATVSLTLGRRAVGGETVTVSYAPPDTNPLQDADNAMNPVPGFSDRPVTNTAQAPVIDLVRIVSWPTHDANGDGTDDTYVRGDEILVDVEFSEPVEVTGGGDVRLRLAVGADDETLKDSREVLKLDSVRYGGRTLRFAYAVKASHEDADGVWVQVGASNRVVFEPNADDRVVSAITGVAANLTKSGLPTEGDPRAKVDGSRTSVDGPTPSSAAVNGDTLTVTFDKSLGTSVDTGELALELLVKGPGGIDGGDRHANQHPMGISVSGATLTLTLGTGALAGETVTLTYGGDRLKDADGNRAPRFRDLAVTNDTPGTARPSLLRAFIEVRRLRLVFDGALDEASAPAGSAFVVATLDSDDDARSVAGTGTAAISGEVVTVTLAKALRADEQATVSYTKPDAFPLQGAGADKPAVRSFDRFRIETVDEGVPPELLGGAVSSISSSKSKVVLSFDEALDTAFTPAAGDFAVTVGGTSAVPSSVAIEGGTVVLTLDTPAAAGTAVVVSYTPGANPIRDQAGNAAAAFTRTLSAAGSGKPSLQSAAVGGARVVLTYDKPLDPGSVPGAAAFTLRRQLHEGERPVYRDDITAVGVEGRTVVLRLEHPMYPCVGETPITVTYAVPGTAPLQGLDGTHADGHTDEDVTNARSGDCVNGIYRGREGSIILTARRPFAKDAPPRSEWFTVTASGGPVAVTGAAFSPDNPNELKLTLSRDLAPGETVTVSYRRPKGERGLWDVDGKQLVDVVDMPVENDAPGSNQPATGAPAITGTVRVGETLTASTAGIEDADGLSGASFAFQWVSGGADVAGATGESYTLADSDEGSAITVRVAFTDDAGHEETLTSAATEAVAPRLPPLTAAFEGVPAEHGGRGSEFSFELRFSEDFPGRLPYKLLRDEAVQATNGRVTGAARVAQNQSQRWTITVRPHSSEDVTVTLPATADCDAAGAICTPDGRPLSSSSSATVIGPVGISVADARVEEDEGAVLAFAVALSRAASRPLTVDYATSDGSAQAGADYTATSGTLTFQAGDSTATIEVAVLDDSHDEGEETLTLSLSNPSSGLLTDGEATGTIENRDPLPRALLARFGRTAAAHVVEHVEERLQAPREPGIQGRFAGREVRKGMERDFALSFLDQLGASAGVSPLGGAAGVSPLGGAAGVSPLGGAAGVSPLGGAAGVSPLGGAGHGPVAGLGGAGFGGLGSFGTPGLGGTGMPGAVGAVGSHGAMPGAAGAMGSRVAMPGGGTVAMGGAGMTGGAPGPMTAGAGPDGGLLGGGLQSMGLGGDNLLTGSSFAMNRESRGGILSFWSRGARSRFAGREGTLGLNGDVRTTMFGADYARGPIVAGLSLSHSRGLGEYSGVANGQVLSSVTGLYPWMGYKATERITVWGVGGYGGGGLLLTPGGGPALESGLSMKMAAAGTRGELVTGGASGFELAFKADALWVGTSIDGVDGPAGRLKATDAAVTRFRTGLEGSRAYTLAGRLSLTPSVEVGLRHDGGDAETGAGTDVGAGLVVSDASTGLSLDVRVRTLLVHQDDGFRERGVAFSLSYNPTPSTPLGFTAKVAPSWGGQASGGAEALWGRESMAAMTHGGFAQGNRLDGEVGYGLPVGSRLVGTPRVGFSTSEHGRDYRFGYGLGVIEQGSVNFELGIDAQRRESPLQGSASNGFLGKASLGW